MATRSVSMPNQASDTQGEEKTPISDIKEKTEVSSLLVQITEQKVRIEELKHRIVRLEEEKREEKETYLKAFKRLEKALENKTKEKENLTRELEKATCDHETKVLEIIGQKNDEIRTIKSEAYNTRFELNNTIMDLNEELKGLKDFKEKQEHYYRQIEYWKKRCDELIQIHGDELKQGNQNGRAVQVLKYKLDSRISTVTPNRGSSGRRTASRGFDRLNVTIQDEEGFGYDPSHFRQEGKIKKLKEQIDILKNHIEEEGNKHAKEIEALKYQHHARANELELQNMKLREELKAKMKENKNLKALAQMILDQRSEIEEFLLETLDHVKGEAQKQKVTDRKKKLPDILNKTKQEVKTTRNCDKIDYNELEWEDKEKMLRILLAKMGTGLLPSNWRYSEISQEYAGKLMNLGNNVNQYRSTTLGDK